MTSHGGRAVERCRILASAPFSEMEGGLFRFWLGDAYRKALEQVRIWMEEAGMSVRIDAAGSIIGRYEALTPDAPALMTGSHLDTVRNGGAYDGILGVMLGIEMVAALNSDGIRMPFAIEVVGFGDEEGSRFPAPMLCSRTMAGQVDTVPSAIVDAQGKSIAQAMEDYGLDPALLKNAVRQKGEILAFIEAHIEQGPCLEAEDGSLGVVSAIAAQTRQRVRIYGQADHAGTTPMTLRRDALAAAAEVVSTVERIGVASGENHVATVGFLDVHPNVSNVIPGEVRFSLDMRAETEAQRDRMVLQIQEEIRNIVARRGLKASFEQSHFLPSAACTPEMVSQLEKAVSSVTGRPASRLLSGAGHDAMAMVHLCPMAMLFIRSPGGLSHHPDEDVRVEDVELAHRALLAFVKEFHLS